VPTSKLARVQTGREDLPLRDVDLDAAADQGRVERVFVRVEADGRVGRNPGGKTAVGVGHAARAAIALRSASASRRLPVRRSVRWKRTLARPARWRSSCCW
jgi:hypothetical protein